MKRSVYTGSGTCGPKQKTIQIHIAEYSCRALALPGNNPLVRSPSLGRPWGSSEVDSSRTFLRSCVATTTRPRSRFARCHQIWRSKRGSVTGSVGRGGARDFVMMRRCTASGRPRSAAGHGPPRCPRNVGLPLTGGGPKHERPRQGGSEPDLRRHQPSVAEQLQLQRRSHKHPQHPARHPDFARPGLETP